MSKNQTPPADELAEIRAKLKALDARERVLRALMLVDPSARTGNHYVAEVREIQTTRTDVKEMRVNHPDIVEQYTFKVPERRVEVWAIDQETGEIVRVVRKSRETTDGQ